MASEPFGIPVVRDQVGWRLNKQDKQNLRLLMADRREKVVTNILRDLVEREAALARERWKATASRIAREEEEAEARG